MISFGGGVLAMHQWQHKKFRMVEREEGFDEKYIFKDRKEFEATELPRKSSQF